ncbi:hypothetical protein TD95_001368, partial [Thielaviopsis punctulata]
IAAAQTALGVAAAVTATAAYLDARFHVSKDIDQILSLKCNSKLYEGYGKSRLWTTMYCKTNIHLAKAGRGHIYYWFEDNANAKLNVEALWSRSGSLTFGQLLELSHRYANFFLSKGVKPGEAVALNMLNTNDHIAAWIGLWAIGSFPACINSSLKGNALVHCIRISHAKLVLVGGTPEMFQRHVKMMHEFDKEGTVCINLDDVRHEIYNFNPKRPPDHLRKNATPLTPTALFYTSGTTGMPKACLYPNVIAFPLFSGSLIRWFPQPKDQHRCYNCMPLYHGTGGLCAIGQLAAGQTVCLGLKFSASTFWDDIRDSRATWFTYVGEVPRYLLSAPPSPRDKEHNLHSMFGNGLRPDVWERFQERFGVKTVIEIFASTESVMLFFNVSRGPFFTGSVGHQGALLRWLLRNTYIPAAIHPETGDIQRDPKTGLVKQTSLEAGGELLVEMSTKRKFVGYHGDKDSTEKKYVRNVLKKGDLYYRTGDTLRRDADGRWFFMDRAGDTYRWKSENVSTMEVSQVVTAFGGISEAAVYGVVVPGHEGRAGCAAILLDPAHKATFDWTGFLQHLKSQLPSYAIPVFVRLLPASIAQHNYKLNKMPLQNAGIDPAKTAPDTMLWIDRLGRGSRYVPFGEKEWQSLVSSKPKL